MPSCIYTDRCRRVYPIFDPRQLVTSPVGKYEVSENAVVPKVPFETGQVRIGVFWQDNRKEVCMTQSICIFCGSRKFGAFSVCDNCATEPNDEDQFAKSLLLTDHFYSLEELDEFGEHISAGGTCAYAPNLVEGFVKAIRDIGIENLGDKSVFSPGWKKKFFRGTQVVQTFRTCSRDSLQRYARQVVAGKLTISARIKTSIYGGEGRLVALSNLELREFDEKYWQGHFLDYSMPSEVFKVEPAGESSVIDENPIKENEDYCVLYPVDFLEQHIRERGGWLEDGYYEICHAKELANEILRRPAWELIIYDVGALVDEIFVENNPMVLMQMITEGEVEGEEFASLNPIVKHSCECAFTMFSGL